LRRFLVLVTAVFNFLAGVFLAQGRSGVFAAIIALMFLMWLLALVSQLGGSPRTQ